MRLRAKFLKWSAGVPVAMIHLDTAKRIGINTQDRILIETKNSEKFFTIVDTITDLVKEDQIALSSELQERLSLKKNEPVEVSISSTPRSVKYIRKKLHKEKLSNAEINAIVRDINNNSISEAEIALFVSSMYKQGMTIQETIYLTNAILKTGNKLKLGQKLIVDKHSIGGIPGNRTTPLVVSICAAAGLTFPKTSSRAITSAAGTADVIESVAKVDFSIKELEKIIKKTGASLVWGGSLGLVPADSKIIRIEKILKLDPEAQLLASIMSKKLAVGSNYILIDIPYGKGAKVNKSQALKLKMNFEKLARHFKKKILCVLTDGKEPIGNGIGPNLEIKDIIKILDPKKQGPLDLEDKALFLSGKILEMTNKAKEGKGAKMAMDILDSGDAYEKFKEIITAQKGSLENIPSGKYKKDILIKKKGKITQINNKEINSLARLTGSPIDKAAGIYLYKHVGQEVRRGEKIITLYAESKSRLKESIKYFKKNKPIKIE